MDSPTSWLLWAVGGRVRRKGLPFPSRLGPGRREELALPDWGLGRPSPPPGPSPQHRAGRLGRSRPALLARWVLPGRASASSPFPFLSLSPPLLPLPFFFLLLLLGPALRGRAGRAAPARREWPARGSCPGSRDWRRKAWVASGRLRAPQTP